MLYKQEYNKAYNRYTIKASEDAQVLKKANTSYPLPPSTFLHGIAIPFLPNLLSFPFDSILFDISNICACGTETNQTIQIR